METFGLVFGFLHFYRRLIIGILLLVGLFYFLLIGLDGDGDGRGTASLRDPIRSTDPMPLDIDQSANERADGKNENDVLGMDDPSLLEFGSDSSDTTEDIRAFSDGSMRSELLNSGSADDLIKELLKIKSATRSSSPPVTFALSNDQKRLAERLLTKDLSKSQKRYATRTFIEALSMLDSLNNLADFRVDSVAEELQTKVAIYLDHPDEQISSIANLAMVVSTGTRYLSDASLEKLNEVEQETELRFDRIVQGARSTNKLGELVIAIKNSPVLKEETKAFASKVQERLERQESESSQSVARALKERLCFGEFELPTIVERMAINPIKADGDINSFFDEFEQIPDASLRVQQVALDIIRESIKQNEKKRASELIERMEKQILPFIADDKKRNSIKGALDELKRYL